MHAPVIRKAPKIAQSLLDHRGSLLGFEWPIVRAVQDRIDKMVRRNGYLPSNKYYLHTTAKLCRRKTHKRRQRNDKLFDKASVPRILPQQKQIMGHACVYASLILNHTWKKFSGATPSAKTFGKVSSVQTFRVWGAVACARIHQPQPQGPFDARGVNSYFVVLNITSKGYKLAWWPEVFPKFRELTICRRIHR